MHGIEGVSQVSSTQITPQLNIIKSAHSQNVKSAAIPLRSVHDDVFYVPTKMPAAKELVLPARARVPSASLDEREQDERAHNRYEHS